MIASLQEQCKTNADGVHIICLQDTSEYNYQRHFNRLRKESLGIVGNNIDHGFFAHVMLCFDAISTLPLGMSFCKLWDRNPNRLDKYERKYKKLPIEEKESFRWLEAAKETKELLNSADQLTFISDRESDIYQLWSRIPDTRTNLIIRARSDRSLYDKFSTVFETIKEQAVVGSYTIELKEDKRKNRTRRTAKLNVKYTNVFIKKSYEPKSRKTNDPDYINLYVVEAKEDESTIKAGESAVHWILYTTHRIDNYESARQIIRWYSFRWQIEQFFRITKKQGLDAESSQLETGEALMKLILMSFAVAMKILQLCLAREGTYNDRVEKYFDSAETIVLKVLNNNLQGNTIKQQNPFPEKTLSWASWIIARLGGYSGYKSQSPPGPITYKWGLDKFNQLVEGFYLAKKDVYKE